MTEPEARAIAEAGFTFIAADPELVGALLAQTGADAGALRGVAAQPEFAGFVLDFLLENDRRVLDFAACENIAPGRVVMARAVLGGADPW